MTDNNRLLVSGCRRHKRPDVPAGSPLHPPYSNLLLQIQITGFEDHESE